MRSIATPVNPADVAANSGCDRPETYRSRVLPRERRALGDAAGLTKFGVIDTTLGPGTASSMRHWHTHEEEFVIVPVGEFVIRGAMPTVLREIGNRDADDTAHYPEVGLQRSAPVARNRYTHKDGWQHWRPSVAIAIRRTARYVSTLGWVGSEFDPTSWTGEYCPRSRSNFGDATNCARIFTHTPR